MQAKQLTVVRTGHGHRLVGDGPLTDLANGFLAHLEVRGFAAGTIRGYAYDMLNFGRFLAERRMSIVDVTWRPPISSITSTGSPTAGRRGAATSSAWLITKGPPRRP